MNDRLPASPPIAFDNSYAQLPGHFHARLAPTPVAAPKLIRLNEPLAAELGLDADWLKSPDGVAMLAGSRMPEGADPIAMAYAGHQFGNFVPQLGDGRAMLVGEVIDRAGHRRDIQLKGSGRTPFSRGGDGRAALGPVLREYLVSEAFAALGIPTTRSLAAVATGEHVFRELPLPGAVLTRLASSHIRVGTFQYFAARGDTEAIRKLADHVIDRHYPDARAAPNPYLALYESVLERQASLVARWMHVGFIHGVMNTDNMSIAGESIDFGPCAFLDAYEPGKVFSSIDRGGRYAYANQPRIAQWNLARLAETLLPLLGNDETAAASTAQAALDRFSDLFAAAYLAGAQEKLGLMTEHPEDLTLYRDLLAEMEKARADYTITFDRLTAILNNGSDDSLFLGTFAHHETIGNWIRRWRARISSDRGLPSERERRMRRANPVIIPRNHRIEEAIAAATVDGDFSFFHSLVNALANPFDVHPEIAPFTEAPAEHEEVRQTFCGT